MESEATAGSREIEGAEIVLLKMMWQVRHEITTSRVWVKVASMVAILFFILLADAILSDWVPTYMESSMNSPFLMGLVMSFSSVVGFASDLMFPQLLRGIGVRKLLFLAILVGGAFSGVLMLSIFRPVIVVFLLGMALWGVYYEFLGFANQQFVAETAPTHDRAKVWAVMGVFKNMAYLLGPILGGWLAGYGNSMVVGVSAGVTLVALLIINLIRMPHREAVLEPTKINLLSELGHWKVLVEHVWPVIVISVILGLVDATFWSVGTVFNDALAEKVWYGGFFMSVFTLPSLFIGLLVARWGIYKGKKKWAELFMLMSGVVLSLLPLMNKVEYILAVVFVSSCLSSVTYPLVDAVYSDIVSRMGRERKHMVGLTNSTSSLAYIVGPILAGGIAQFVGVKNTFMVMGTLTALVAVVLLFVTPKKLKLPQSELARWE